MKKVLSLLLLAFVMCQCNNQPGQQNQQQNQQPAQKSLREQYPEKFTEKYISDQAMKLIEFVPDHKFETSIKPAFTESYFNLLEEAWTVPVYDFGIIGDDEWLYYFMTGNGGCECTSHPKTVDSVKVLDDENALVKMNYIHEDHDMALHFENGDWVIADFDGTKDELAEYIREQRDGLMKLDLDSLNTAMLKEFVGDKKEVEEWFNKYKSSIDAYFKKYPK